MRRLMAIGFYWQIEMSLLTYLSSSKVFYIYIFAKILLFLLCTGIEWICFAFHRRFYILDELT